MKHMTYTALGPLALAALMAPQSPALAGQAVDQTLKVGATDTVEIEVVSETLEVRAWDRAEVQITGELEHDEDKLRVSQTGGQTRIDIDRHKGRNRGGGQGHLVISVPQGARLDIDAVSGGVVISGVSGEVEAENVSGDIHLSGHTSAVRLEAISGALSYTSDAALARGEFKTLSGPVTLDTAVASGARAEVNSVSGGVQWTLPQDTSARVEFESLSGGFSCALPFTDEPGERRRHDREGALGGGDAKIEIETVSGGLSLLAR